MRSSTNRESLPENGELNQSPRFAAQGGLRPGRPASPRLAPPQVPLRKSHGSNTDPSPAVARSRRPTGVDGK